jgi:hypothetical protein
MNKIPKIAYFIAGFVLLTILLISVGLVTSKRMVQDKQFGPTIHQFRAEKDDIIETEPVLMEPYREIEGDVVSYQSRIKDIIRSDKPLPLLPTAIAPVDPGLLQEKGVLKNLYKESNSYYIDGNEEKKPQFHKGIKN